MWGGGRGGGGAGGIGGAKAGCLPATAKQSPPPRCRLPQAGPRRGALGAQHTSFSGPVLMRHTIDAYESKGFANITGAGRVCVCVCVCAGGGAGRGS
jgi:hypothetical protein